MHNVKQGPIQNTNWLLLLLFVVATGHDKRISVEAGSRSSMKDPEKFAVSSEHALRDHPSTWDNPQDDGSPVPFHVEYPAQPTNPFLHEPPVPPSLTPSIPPNPSLPSPSHPPVPLRVGYGFWHDTGVGMQGADEVHDEGYLSRKWEWPTPASATQGPACRSLHCPRRDAARAALPSTPRWISRAMEEDARWSRENSHKVWVESVLDNATAAKRASRLAYRAAHHITSPDPPPRPPPSLPGLPVIHLHHHEKGGRVVWEDVLINFTDIPHPPPSPPPFAWADEAPKWSGSFAAEKETWDWKECAGECSQFGTCNLELGRCDCLPGRAGEACDRLAAPSCTLRRVSPSGEELWPLSDHPFYHLPCTSAAHKTCACEEECDSLGVTFVPTSGRTRTKCKDSEGEVVAKLSRCRDWCSFNGWCDHHEVCHCFVGWEGKTCHQAAATYCVGGCSGKGTCRAGTCHCVRGFYGADCSLYKGEVWPVSARLTYRDAKTAPVSGIPHVKRAVRVYVYELPPYLNTWLYYHRSETFGHGTVHASLHGNYHGNFYVGAAELFLHERFATSAHRTTDPEKADFFFVPFWQRAAHGLRDGGGFLRRVVSYVQTTWPYWNRKAGSDHLFVMAGPMGMCDTTFAHTKGSRPREIRNAVVLTHFGGVADPRLSTRSRHVMWKGPCFIPNHDVVLPPPLRVPASASPLLHAGVSRPRVHTLFFSGRTPAAVVAQRGARMGRFDTGDRLKDALLEAHNVTVGRPGYMINPGDHKLEMLEYVDLMATSIFCLAPAASAPGWGMRLVEAIVHGCIPVIVQDQVHQPYDDYLNYDEFSIRIQEDQIQRLPQILNNLVLHNRDEISNKQEKLGCVVRRFLWSSVYGRYGVGLQAETGLDDAFATLLDVLNMRRLARPVQADATMANGTIIPHVRSVLLHPPPAITPMESLCASDARVQQAADNNKPQIPSHNEYVLCRKYCKHVGHCKVTDDLSSAQSGHTIDQQQLCLRAPGQPAWLPWPYGGASHQ